ncbi:GapR family DNA-binding domain-containing protein [Devosia sp. SL43]|uniref:GapR family DNA-binding domain-containing protein n=1 Tax=Devosia sp. SL43 TaxID=2806348 RepID=UPI001F1B9246|nr:GapR family DNA-binding domain-containing protein [Devosia sp. SL43]UJW87917.1 DUF2312 domain-containing protein [Devosia sp. SL43]
MTEGSNSIADDLLRNGYERWARLEGEKAAISEDLKELFGELKANGLDGKALRAAFRKVAKAGDTEADLHDATVDLYVGSLLGPRIKPSGTKVATQARDARKEIPETRPLNQAGPDVGPSSSSAAAEGRVVTSLAGAEGIVDRQPINQPHPTKADGSDLTASPGPHGQVADNSDIDIPISSEAGDELVTSPVDATDHGPVGTGNDARNDNAGGENVAADDDVHPLDDDRSHENGERADALALGSDVEAVAPKPPMYAAPGVVVWESSPPEGVRRHEYSFAFGDLGQDVAVIDEDLANAASAPIVKLGNMILDGWARYTRARAMVGLDGKPVEYPVVQYDGNNPLIDVIRWNMNGRILNEEQRRLIAKRLVSIEPHRKAEIFKALDMGMELVGA